jgi:hypothetical protein
MSQGVSNGGIGKAIRFECGEWSRRIERCLYTVKVFEREGDRGEQCRDGLVSKVIMKGDRPVMKGDQEVPAR